MKGLRLLKERDNHLDALRRDIAAGFEAVDRGEYTDYRPTAIKRLAQRVKTTGRKRLATAELRNATAK